MLVLKLVEEIMSGSTVILVSKLEEVMTKALNQKFAMNLILGMATLLINVSKVS